MLLDAIAALRADTNGKSRSADAAQALAQLRDRKLEKAALEEEIKASRRAVLVVNTLSRRGAYTYSEVKRQLKKAELILDAFPVRHPERIHEIVLDAIEQGRVLPLGTANSFACTLRIPLNLAGAIDVLINGKVADVDLGKINDDYFANGSSIGMPAVVGRATPHALKKWLGRAAYALVAVNKFMGDQSFRCIVAIGNRKTCFDALGARLALHAPLRPANIEEFRAQKLRIDAIPTRDVAIDGEVIAQTPIQVSVAGNALLLMVPRAYQEFEDRAKSACRLDLRRLGTGQA